MCLLFACDGLVLENLAIFLVSLLLLCTACYRSRCVLLVLMLLKWGVSNWWYMERNGGIENEMKQWIYIVVAYNYLYNEKH